MLVGIISDTHGVLPIKAEAAMAECDHIVHAGDICDPDILALLQAHAPVTAVLGNNDYREYGPDVDRFGVVELDGVKFLVAHYPKDVMLGMRSGVAGDVLPDVCVHGHTHIAHILTGADAQPAKMILCPGSCTRPRRGPASVAKIAIENNTVVEAWVEAIEDGRRLMEWSRGD